MTEEENKNLKTTFADIRIGKSFEPPADGMAPMLLGFFYFFIIIFLFIMLVITIFSYLHHVL